MPSPPDIKSDDYYKVLGVDRSATDSEIAKAYKRLALKYHPDKNPGNKEQAEENFKIITDAYGVLHDPEKRKAYDQFGKAGVGGGGGVPGEGVSFQQADEIFKAFFGGNDPFKMFFSGDDDDFGSGGGFFGGGGMPSGTRVVFNGMPRSSGGAGPGGLFDMMGGMPGMHGMAGKGGGKGGRHSAQPTPPHAMPNGTVVTVRDLTKAQEHNGKTGKIKGWDADKGRYEVELEGEAALSLRPANLTQQCRVSIVGIESQPELNGKSGRILNFQQAPQGRYMVKLEAKMPNGRDTVGLQPANVMLEKGTRVVTQGLSNEQFNGQMAQIVDIDLAAMRYTVHCQSGKSIKIRFDNVLC